MQQVENPQAEGDIGIDEIAEAQHEEVDSEIQGDTIGEDIDRSPENDLGNPWEVVVQSEKKFGEGVKKGVKWPKNV